MKIQDIIKKKPYIAWHINKDSIDSISISAALESILNYGQWEDTQEAIAILGINEASGIFNQLSSKKRSNLSSRVKNFFQIYFEKHAH